MNRSQIYVALAALGFSFILIFAKVLKGGGMSSFEQLFFRLVFSFLILTLVLSFSRKLLLTKKKGVPFFVAIGFTYAFFALSGLTAIAFGISIAVSIALVYTQPIFTALIAFMTRKEKVTVANAAVVALGVAGAFIVSGLNLADPQINLGILFPVLAGLLYAVYLWLKRQAPIRDYTPLQILFNTFLFAIPVLLMAWIFLLSLGVESLVVGFLTPNLEQLALLFLFGLFSTVLPYGLLNYVKVEEVSSTAEGVLLLGDPLLHTFWAMMLFGEFISMIQYVGAVLVLTSAAISLRMTARNAG